MILDQVLLYKKSKNKGFKEDKTSEKPIRSVIKAIQ